MADSSYPPSLSRTINLSLIFQYFKFILCEDVVSDNHRFWFRYRIGYGLLLISSVLFMSLPQLIIVIFDIYVYRNPNLSIDNIFPWQVFFIVIFIFIEIPIVRFTPIPLYYTDQIVLSDIHKLQCSTSKTIIVTKIIMIIISAAIPFIPGIAEYCLPTKIVIADAIYTGLYVLVGIYLAELEFNILSTSCGVFTFTKFYFLEEVVNIKRDSCFRFRIGYLVIVPLIYLVSVILQYVPTLMFCAFYPLDSTATVFDYIFGIMMTLIDLFVTIIFMRRTQKYFLDVNASQPKNVYYPAYHRSLAIIISNAIQVIILFYVANPDLRLTITPIISIALWVAYWIVKLIYYGIRALNKKIIKYSITTNYGSIGE
jgi:hypothetical protein